MLSPFFDIEVRSMQLIPKIENSLQAMWLLLDSDESNLNGSLAMDPLLRSIRLNNVSMN